MARDFNGSTDRIDYASVLDLNGSALTIAAWVYIDSIVYENYVTIHPSGDASEGVMLQQWTAGPKTLAITRTWSTSGANKRRDGVGEISTGSWLHVMATSDSGADDSGMECYVDGSVPGSSASTAGSGSENNHDGSWSLGGRIYDDNRNFEGRMAEIGVWNRVLSADERAALAKAFSPLHFRRGLKFYTKLLGQKDIDIMAGKTPTYDGTSVIAHPRIIYPG